MSESTEQPQQLINGQLKPLSGMEAHSDIPVIRSKAEYLKAVMYEGVRLPSTHRTPPTAHLQQHTSNNPQPSLPFTPQPYNHLLPPHTTTPPRPTTNPPHQVTILEGTATWCAQCKAIAPEVSKMVAEYPSVKFFLYDVEECEDVAQELGVTSMPSFSIFKDGDIQDGVTGAKPKEIRKKIEACL